MSPIQKAAPEDAVQGRCAAVRLAHFCRQPVSHPSAGGGDHLRIVVDAEDRTGGTSRDSQGGEAAAGFAHVQAGGGTDLMRLH